MNRKSTDDTSWPVPVQIGMGLSVLWFGFLIFYALTQSPPVAGAATIPRWQAFWRAPPNEFGDALAGIFAPLAFLWLVVATFLQRDELQAQRKELEQNREALMLQAEELKNSVAQLTKQTEIFASERQDANRAELENLIYKELTLLAKFCLSNLEQTFWAARPLHSGQQHLVSLFAGNNVEKYRSAERPDEAFIFLNAQIANFIRNTQAQYDSTYSVIRSDNLDKISEAIQRSEKILTLSVRVPGTATETHVNNVGLAELRDQLLVVRDRLSKLPTN